MTSPHDRWILPPLLNAACSSPSIAAQRAKFAPLAEGLVLELGVGMGLGRAHYDGANVAEVIDVDPSLERRFIPVAARPI